MIEKLSIRTNRSSELESDLEEIEHTSPWKPKATQSLTHPCKCQITTKSITIKCNCRIGRTLPSSYQFAKINPDDLIRMKGRQL